MCENIVVTLDYKLIYHILQMKFLIIFEVTKNKWHKESFSYIVNQTTQDFDSCEEEKLKWTLNAPVLCLECLTQVSGPKRQVTQVTWSQKNNQTEGMQVSWVWNILYLHDKNEKRLIHRTQNKGDRKIILWLVCIYCGANRWQCGTQNPSNKWPLVFYQIIQWYFNILRKPY